MANRRWITICVKVNAKKGRQQPCSDGCEARLCSTVKAVPQSRIVRTPCLLPIRCASHSPYPTLSACLFSCVAMVMRCCSSSSATDFNRMARANRVPLPFTVQPLVDDTSGTSAMTTMRVQCCTLYARWLASTRTVRVDCSTASSTD